MADDAADSGAAAEAQPAVAPLPKVSVSWMAFAAGVIGVVVMAGLAGWLSFRAYETHQADVRRDLFVHAARQGAVTLTTIDHAHADADTQRILDSATGSFHDNFAQRWRPFLDLVKRQRSKLVGTVSDAGLESQTGDTGQVLVAVTVKTSNPGHAQEEPQVWRMRITVQKIGDQGKISNVAFVS